MLIDEIFQCELCGRPHKLVVHHIMRGPLRKKSTGKRFANLVLCRTCHDTRMHGNEHWPETRQLAVLKLSRPEDYSLYQYNLLKNPNAPNRITEADVSEHGNTRPIPTRV